MRRLYHVSNPRPPSRRRAAPPATAATPRSLAWCSRAASAPDARRVAKTAAQIALRIAVVLLTLVVGIVARGSLAWGQPSAPAVVDASAGTPPARGAAAPSVATPPHATPGAPATVAPAPVDALEPPAPPPVAVPPPPPPPPHVAAPIAPAVPPAAAPATPSAPPAAAAAGDHASPASPSSASSASARAAQPGEIRVHEKSVVTLHAARGGHTAQERARTANAALEALLAQPEDMGDTRFEETQGTAVIFVGKTPIVTLGPEDVEASGDASLNVLAADVTTRLAQGISTERKRSAIATTVFSFSLLVFSALLVFLFLNRMSEMAARMRARIGNNPEKVTGLRLGKIEFISAGAARGALSVTLSLGHRFIQVATAYGWLIFALSLFEATRGYTERLTGMVVKPLYGLATRVGGALPLVVVAAIAITAVTILVRFVGLFFDSISRGDTRVAWLSRDLARPTSILAQFAIVIVALVLASPLITGETDGVISRVGLVALISVSLAATPLLASGVVGITVVFGRRMKRGDDVEVGGRKGKVLDVTLLEVRIEDDALAEVSVPHLLGLFHPTRVLRHARLATLDIVVDATAPQDEVERVLFAAARAHSSRGRVELVHLDATGAHWRVTSASMRHDISLAKVVQDALAKLGVGLGGDSRARRSPPEARPGTDARPAPPDNASARPEAK